MRSHDEQEAPTLVDRVTSVEAATAAFRTLAEAEGSAVPMYGALCEAIAERPGIASLLLEAPVGQRLPVLVLAALHDLVLDHPDLALADWFPSAGGDAAHDGDLGRAVATAVDQHRERLVDRVRHRQVQTNEVNRCVGWRIALGELCAQDRRPLSLIEVGASAGLNLALDRCAIDVTAVDGAGGDPSDSPRVLTVGPADAVVRLSTEVRRGPWPHLGDELPPVVERIGLDQAPLDATDPDDARWLLACIWPEQAVRLTRLRAALAAAAVDAPELVTGDLVDDTATLVGSRARSSHVVVLSSWTLAYVDRPGRLEFLDRLASAAAAHVAAGGAVSLVTLDGRDLLPWVQPPPDDPTDPPERRHASLLAITRFDRDGSFSAQPLALCQAHLAWIERC
jgi:hypothetical protein